MKDLFYTPGDNFIFWVAGYDVMSNESNLLKAIARLKEDGQKFADFIGVDINDVLTFHNPNPPRYQYMRVFYIKKPEDMPIPQTAFIWDNLKTIDVAERDEDGRLIRWVKARVQVKMMDVLTR